MFRLGAIPCVHGLRARLVAAPRLAVRRLAAQAEATTKTSSPATGTSSVVQPAGAAAIPSGVSAAGPVRAPIVEVALSGGAPSGSEAAVAAPLPAGTTATSATAGVAAAAKAGKPKMKLWKKVLVGVGTVFVGVPVTLMGAAFVYLGEDRVEKVKRQATFWSAVGPILIDYSKLQKQAEGKSKAEKDEIYRPLHEKHAPAVLKTILALGGYFIKLGQQLSMRTDMLPEQYTELFATLQDGVPPLPGTYARNLIQKELGRPVSDLFAAFEDRAIGAASIGQVHAATLHDGREVVVKIQYPEAQRMFFMDMSMLRAAARLASPESLPMLDEFERQYKTEFDFKREAWALETVSHNINPIFGKEVVVPRPIPGMASSRVVVMERLYGDKLIDGIKKQWSQLAALRGQTLDDLKRKMKDEPMAGPPRLTATTARVLDWLKWGLSLRSRAWNGLAWVYNGTMGRVGLGSLATTEEVPYVNGRAVVDLLLRVHAHEIFVDGVFNGDPHPGNILLLKDGRLGLIDYGNVKELSWDDRVKLATLIVTIKGGNRKEIAACMADMGYRTRDMNPYVLEKLAVIYFDRDDLSVTEGMPIMEFVDKLAKMDKVEASGDNFLMAAQTNSLIRALTLLMGVTGISGVDAWLPYARDVLDKEAKRVRAGTTVLGASSASPVAATA